MRSWRSSRCWSARGRTRNETSGDIDHVGTPMIVAGRGRIVWRVDGGPREVAALLRKL